MVRVITRDPSGKEFKKVMIAILIIGLERSPH